MKGYETPAGRDIARAGRRFIFGYLAFRLFFLLVLPVAVIVFVIIGFVVLGWAASSGSSGPSSPAAVPAVTAATTTAQGVTTNVPAVAVPTTNMAAITECLSLHGQVGAGCSDFAYFGYDGAMYYGSAPVGVEGNWRSLASGAATQAQCLAFRTADPSSANGSQGEPTRWESQAQLCTSP